MASNRPGGHGGLDIWVARRASTDAPFGAPENLGEPINSAADDFCPTPVRGSGLFFVSRRTTAESCGLGDIYFSRLNPARGWATPSHLACAPEGPNSALDEQGPSYVEVDGRSLLYFSRSSASVPGDIYVSEQLADESFGPASPVAELNTAANDIQPNVRKDGLEVVFSSNHAYPGAQGGQDVYVSTRASGTIPGRRRSTSAPPSTQPLARRAPPSPGTRGRSCSGGRPGPRGCPTSTSPPATSSPERMGERHLSGVVPRREPRDAVSGEGAAGADRSPRQRRLTARGVGHRPALERYAASTFGMISSFSRLRSSSVFDTGTSANGGQSSGMVSPASW